MLRTKTQSSKLPIHLELPATAPSGGGLKQLLGPGVLAGCALGDLNDLNPIELSLALEQFNAITPENCMKLGVIQPAEGVFHFQPVDDLVDFAQKHRLECTGHCLVWHQQYPLWFFQDGDAPASRGLVLDRLTRHIHTVMGRYRGRIRGWDVVNEAIADGDGTLRQTPWTQVVGDDFLQQAFRIAHDADPQAELYYNDFNIELPVKREKTLKLLRQLLDKGSRIDGVGIQGHWVLNQIPYEEIEMAILAYHQLGLKVMITELDIDIMDRPDCGADVSWQVEAQRQFDPYSMGCPPEVIEQHNDQYGRLFELFAAHKDKLSRISFWGLHDGRSWLNYWPWHRKNYPLLFNRDCEPKAAFHEVASRISRVITAPDRRA